MEQPTTIEQSVAEEPPARAAMIGPPEERAGASMVASPMSLDLLCAGFAKVPFVCWLWGGCLPLASLSLKFFGALRPREGRPLGF